MLNYLPGKVLTLEWNQHVSLGRFIVRQLDLGDGPLALLLALDLALPLLFNDFSNSGPIFRLFELGF